ncbi:SDR family NAD(P)-dependent oxidoreductase [Nocardia jinanensis]|uniref:Short-chain dehydrogenase n=1 Tax=Nocardia jinanensis TaxID=382504 RepID=A0A917RNS3_9NOCA|nr:SDR family oxidoreductase [Nocardia jinanensis]GGL16457.1 short-chain dehydrogenase [Nocardia jinanensis]
MTCQVVLVTGAAGGIGAATARLLAERGSDIVLVDRDASALESVSAAVAAAGARALVRAADVTDEHAVAAAFAAAYEQFDRVDGLVNSAATMISTPLIDTTVAEWNSVLSVNITGTFLACREFVRRLRATGRPGAIVNLSSISGSVALPNQAAYCASKGAVAQLSRQIAVEQAPHGIRCNVVSPGSVATDQLATYLAAQPDPAAARTDLYAAHPIGRIGEADEIAAGIAFLLGADAGFVTGADLAMDGGYTSV